MLIKAIVSLFMPTQVEVLKHSIISFCSCNTYKIDMDSIQSELWLSTKYLYNN